MTHPPLKTTTLRELRPIACKDGYDRLATYLGADYGDDTPITMIQILESNGLDHALWALARVAGPTGERVCHLAACAFFDRVAHLVTDPRSQEAVRVKRLWIDGKATDEELSTARASAWGAARDAERGAAWGAWVAARASAEAAARAARAAAWDTAWAAALAAGAAGRDEEKIAQVEIVRKLIAEYSQ